MREDHEPLRRGSDVVSGIAGDQGKTRIGSLLENREIVGIGYFLSGYFIGVNDAATLQLNLITLGELVDVAKERIAMCADHDIARFTGICAALNMTRSSHECTSGGTLHHNGIEIDLGDLDAHQSIGGRASAGRVEVLRRRQILDRPLMFELVLLVEHQRVLRPDIEQGTEAGANQDVREFRKEALSQLAEAKFARFSLTK